MEFDNDTINLDGFEKLVKALKPANAPVAKIGILGANANRKQGKSTNAQIGAAHEFGSPLTGLPVRSTLRMPLTDVLPKDLEATDLFTEDVFKEVVKAGSLTPWLKTVAGIALGTVKKAFATGGFGKWAPWAHGYSNRTGQILVDTTQLRDSYTFEVKE
jgi:hypothetical protein